MEIRADNAGFLVASGQVDLSDERDRLELLQAIKADTAAMRAALVSSSRSPAAVTPAAVAQAVRTAVRQRQAANGPMESLTTPERAVQRRERQPRAAQVADTAAARPNRAANGRFLTAAERNGSAGDNDAGEGREGSRTSKLMGKVGDMAEKLRDGVSGLFAGSEQVDPAIAAAKEVGDIVSPLAAPLKGMGRLLFGGNNEQADREKTEKKIAVPWYRRLWNELRDLNEKPGGSGGSSKVSLGGMGGLLMKLPGIGLLGSLLGKLGGGLKPLLSVLGKASLPLAGIFSAFKSFSTSTEDYARRMGIELNGGLAQELGVRFVGVLGDFGNTLTFGLAGKFGEYIAPAVSKMVDGVIGAWDSTSQWVETKWSEAFGKFNGVLDGLSGLADGARKWFADKFGFVVDTFRDTRAFIANKASEIRSAAEAQIEQAGAAISNGYQAVKEVAIVSGGRLVGRLDKSYRHKESFEGIKGGEGLAKNGTYTNAEAERVRELKTSGANTSGHLKGGMPLPVRNKIIEQATKAGLDPQAMLEIAAVESGGNANAISSTGAIGVYQMVGGTASGLGITDRFDMDQNIAGGMKLAQENAAALRKAGLPVTRDNLYMMHQLGPQAAKEIIQGATSGKTISQLSRDTRKAAGFNIGKGSKTATQYLAANSSALDTKIGKVSTMIPPTLASKPTAMPSVRTAPSIATVAPSAERQAVPPVPSAPRKLASNEPKAQPPMVLEQPLTQNLSDRGLAQAATGGLGMNIGSR